MKRINIFPIILAGATLFTACNKEDQTTVNAPGANAAVVDYNFTSAITYKLVTQPSGMMSTFKWSEGYINTSELIFNDVQKNGDVLTDQKFGTPVIQNVSLFAPSILGVVKMPEINCYAASFEVNLATYVPPREGQSGIATPVHSFFLSGVYNLAVDMPPAPGTPVEIGIDDPVSLTTVWLNNVMISKTSYSATIELSLDQVTAGITPAMMNSATRTNGTVFITSTLNQNLYEIILNNLQGNLIPVQFAAQYAYAPTTPAPPVK